MDLATLSNRKIQESARANRELRGKSRVSARNHKQSK